MTRELPKDIKGTDLAYPKVDHTRKHPGAYYAERRVVDTIEFYRTERFGWVICTLHIRNASRRQVARGVDTARFYAIAVADGQVCTVGLGPHVTDRFTLYVTAARKEALGKYLQLRDQGQGRAGDIRDRISTRRANTIGRGSFLGCLR